MRTKHRQEYDKDTESGVETRLYNIHRRGIRKVSKKRLEPHFKYLSEIIPEDLLKEVNDTIKKILAECMVVIGSERDFADRDTEHDKQFKKLRK